MRKIYDIETDEWLRAVIADNEGTGVFPDLNIQYGDINLSERWEQGDWQINDSGMGWHLSMDVWGRLPGSALDYQNAFLTITADFEGILVPALQAPVSIPEELPDNSTNILAGTPGVLADKIPLGQPVEYPNRTPLWVIRDALYRIPYYDRGHIRIPDFDRPLVDRRLKNGDGFEDSAFPSNVLEAMKPLVSCAYNDTPVNLGHVVSRDVGSGEGQPVVWHFAEDDNRQMLEEFKNPAPAAPDEQYTKVVCRDRFEDGSIKIWEEADVDYSRLRYPPPPGRILFVDFKASETDADEILTAEVARARAVQEAQAFERLLHFGSMVVSFNLFLEPGDVVTIASTREDDIGRYKLSWRAVIEGIMHRFGGSETIITEISYRAMLMQEERITHAPIILPNVSPQIVDYETLDVA